MEARLEMFLGPGLEWEHKELAYFVSSGRVGVEVTGRLVLVRAARALL